MPHILLLVAGVSRNWRDWLAPDALSIAQLLTIGLSVLAVIVSILALRTARKGAAVAARSAKYDYTVRLQIQDEKIAANQSEKQVLGYSAKLVNAGLKPVRIDRMFIDYGGQVLDRCFHAVIDGKSDIAPTGERLISFKLRQSDYEEALRKFAIKACFVRLRVRYINVNDEIEEAERNLIVLTPDGGTVFYASRGEALT